MKKNKKESQKILVTKDGPYMVCGSIPLFKEDILVDEENVPLKWKKISEYPCPENYALCRCGKSSNKPFCDGTHAKINFNGTEKKQKKYLEGAGKLTGPDLILLDNEKLCSGAHFCHRAGSIWNLVEKPKNSQAREIAIQEACNCPSGRLIVLNKEGKAIEAKFNPSVSITEDSPKGLSGPIWVKGGVKIVSSEGKEYEIRNRVTLCRCGRSSNKPFCDGSHISVGFNDKSSE